MGLCTYRDAVLIIPPLALPSPRQPTGHDSPEGGIDVPNRPGRARAMSVAGRQAHWQRGRPARGEPCPAQRSLQVQQAAMGTCGSPGPPPPARARRRRSRPSTSRRRRPSPGGRGRASRRAGAAGPARGSPVVRRSACGGPAGVLAALLAAAGPAGRSGLFLLPGRRLAASLVQLVRAAARRLRLRPLRGAPVDGTTSCGVRWCIRSETAGGVIAQKWYQYRSRLGGDSTTVRYSAPPGADGIEPHVV